MGSITFEVTGFRNDNGFLLICLFNSDETFPGEYDQAVMKIKSPIRSQSSSGLFLNVPFGTYAISAFHDEDNNGEVRRNFIGIPREGVGVSNNPAPRMGPPRWEDAKFTLFENKAFTIEMNYP